jgi:hypothetical protein
MNIEFNVMLQNTWKWKHCMKQIVKELSIAQQKHHKSCLKICKHRETIYHHGKILRSDLVDEIIHHSLVNKIMIPMSSWFKVPHHRLSQNP